MTTVTLTRHGRTAWHDGNRYTGSSDLDIDEQGRRQAERLARWATRTRPDLIYASTMRRARQTAEPVAAALGLHFNTDDRLRELDFGAAEGRTLGELRVATPRAVELFEYDAAAYHLPGGEHPERAADRATEALFEISARHPGQHVLVISHNTLIRLMVCRFLGIPLGRYRTALRGMEPTAITRLSFGPDSRVTLDHYNQLPGALGS